MQPIPYRSLFKTALLTAPLIAIAMVTPIFIASGLEAFYFWIMLPAILTMVFMAWLFNIFLLRFRPSFGRFPWVQLFITSGLMITVSVIMLNVIDPELPKSAQRLPAIRYINVVAVNTIIYILIDLRLLSDSRVRLAAENARLQFSNLETQYKLLKDQINPHFLFNALGTAKSLVRRDPELAEAYIIRLSDFLRASLGDAPDSVPLRDELKLVRDYLELQQIRFRDALRYDCQVDPKAENLRIPYFALLTLVENAVKHNAMSQDAPLHIRVTLSGNRLTVWNNRQAKVVVANSPHTGLHNLSERCRVLGHGEIEVQETADAFGVTLSLLPE